MIDAVLLAHLAEVDEQVRLAVLPGHVWRVHLEAVEVRTRADDVDVLRSKAAALHGDLLVAFVSGDDDVSRPECHPLEEQQATVHKSGGAPNLASYISGDRS